MNKKKTKQRIRLHLQIMETKILTFFFFFTKTTLVLANTPITNGFTDEKSVVHVKR